MTEQPSIVRAIFLSFLGLILFYFTNFVVALILGIIIYFLAGIPILSIASKWFSRFLSPDSYLIPICGYMATLFVIGKLSKEKATADLSCVLLGAYLLLISVMCMILNLIYGNPIWINIFYGITGIVFIVRKSNDADWTPTREVHTMTSKDNPQHEDIDTSPEEKPKGFLSKLIFIASCVIAMTLIAISVLLGGASVIEIVLKIISIAGGGSLIRGIILAPFFVFGTIQIIRGFFDHIEDAGYAFENKYGKTPKGDFLYTMYLLASIASYVAVALAIYFAAWA